MPSPYHIDGMASDGDTLHSSTSRSASEDLSAVETLTREGSKLITQKRLRHSIKKYTEAYELAEGLGDQVTLQSCACNLGAALIAQGKAERAIKYLKNALPQKHSKHGKKSRNKSVLADLHYNLGLGYSLLGSSDNSIKSFTSAIELFIACEDVRGFAEGYHQLGEQYLRKQQLSTAAKCFEESSKAFGEVKDLFSEAKMLLKQGECIVIHGKEKQGLEVAKYCDSICETLHISSEFGSSSYAGKKARCFHDLGILYSKLHSHESASRWYEAALANVRSFKVTGAENQEARILENLGLTCNMIQQYSRAIQLHKEAASLHGSLGNSTERGWCFYHLAEAYRNLGQHADAERTYHVASQIFEDAGQSHWHWKVLVGLGDLSYDRRNLDMAVHFYKDALKQLSEDRSDESKPFENHVLEKLVLALQVQRAGMVRIASYKTRTPVLINPELEKIVLESMSSALQLGMNFDDGDLPKLPKMNPKDLITNYEPLSPTFSPSHSLRPLTYGSAIPSPIIESPARRPSLTRAPSGNHLTPPSRQRKSRRHKKIGRRRLDSYEAPVTKGVDSYSSATDLSLIDSNSARELRIALRQEQLKSVEKDDRKKALKKMAKKAVFKKGRRRKTDDNQIRPENVLQGLEHSSNHHRRKHKSKPILAQEADTDETGAIPSTSTGSHTTHGSIQSSANTLTSVTSATSGEEDVFFPNSQNEEEEKEESGDDRSMSGSESEVSEDDSEDEWDEDEDDSFSDSSDGEGTLSGSNSEADIKLGSTYEKPMGEPLYATIRSKDATVDLSKQDTLYETLNSTAGSYELASTVPLRDPDSPPPPEPPASERPNKSFHSRSFDSDEDSTLSTSNGRQSYPPSPIMTQHTRASREAGLYELAKVEHERTNYVRQLSVAKELKNNKPSRSDSKRKEKVTSAMCAVM